MTQTRSSKPAWALLALIFLLAAAVLLPASPVYRPIPTVDLSVFLYVGRRILEGGMPYRDAWDHKQPLVYLLCAFGQWLTPGSLWGVWAVLLACVGSASLALFHLLYRLHGRFLAFFSVSAGLLALAPILWGGSIEEFTLPAQALAVLCLGWVVAAKSARQRWLASLGLGVSIGLGFFSKQNLFAAGAAGLVYLAGQALLTRRWRDWQIFAGALIGFILVALPLVGYLASAGVMRDYWQAAFVFNSQYAGLGLLERVTASLDALEYMSTLPGLWVCLAAWAACAGIVFLQACPWLKRILCFPRLEWIGVGLGLGMVGLSLAAELVSKQPGLGLLQILAAGGGIVIAGFCTLLFIPRVRAAMLAWLDRAPRVPQPQLAGDFLGLNLPLFAFLYFPTILALLVISGRNYVYYFIPFIPFLILSLSSVGYVLLNSAAPAGRWIVQAFLLAVWVSMAYLPLLQLSSAYAGDRFAPLPDIAAYVTGHTRPDETIFAWGKPSTYIYTVTNRAAPTRYFYQAPVFEAGYNTDFAISAAVRRDLETSPPRLFLYEVEPETAAPPSGCPLPVSAEPNTPDHIFAFVCDHYTFAGKVSDFFVFSRK
jgi:hypothetical protein